MAKGRDGKREKYWRQMLRRRADSGMTVADFCASEGLKPTTYHYWQREIRRRDSLSSQANDPALATVQVLDDRGEQASVEIVAKNGYRIRVGEQATTEQVRRVLQAVSALD